MFTVGIVAFLAVLFAILGFWQRMADRAENARKLADLHQALDRGTHKAVAQYPQIKPYLCIGCGSCIQACPEDNVLGLVNGVAHVINGNRCVGHGRCEEVCPVGAITVGLGDLRSRPDIPVLSDQLETNIPGLYIAGELGGLALIRHAVDQGARAVDAIAETLKPSVASSSSDVLDLLIVGAGPAGLSASLRATERKLRFAAISQDDVGGTIRKYPRRKLTLVQTVEIPLFGRLEGREYAKEELVQLWDSLIQKHRLPIQTGVNLMSVAANAGGFDVETSAGPLKCRTVLLALGRRGTPRKLGIPGEDHEKVLYQLVDASTYQQQKLLVVGGGDSAVEAATGLANQRGNRVTISYRKDRFTRLKSRNEERIKEYLANGRVEALFSSDVRSIDAASVTLTRIAHGQSETLCIPNDYVFIFAGGEPPFPLLKKIGIRFGGEAREEHPGTVLPA